MKLTFPYMGSIVIYQKLLEPLGHEIILPNRPTKRTINLGVKYSPEFACFPYKVLLGTYIEALEAGADTIVTSGGSGPCRAGYYCEAHQKTLQSLGYQVEMIVFDSFFKNPPLFLEKARKITNHHSWLKVIKVVYTAYQIARAIDSLQKIVEIKRAYEREPGSFSRAFEHIHQKFLKEAHTLEDVRRLKEEGLTLLNSIPLRDHDPMLKIRIGIVGEIYVVIESSINMGIAEVLNKLGCEVSRSICISEWFEHTLPKVFGKSDARIVNYGRRYIDISIGGHEIQNVGKMIDYKEQGFDGIIHLMPFACLPELITQSMIPKISADLGIPILSLAIDEQTGVANVLTRLEAFVELVKNQKLLRAG
ncbi:MAG: acyl-CoA dehydratase activase-related protein [Firmicutes bacterium]|nr:acyl-CoA dehydratase activase-related protein [Bacillota bacterium]